MTKNHAKSHDARYTNRRLLADKIKSDGLNAVLASMTDEEFKEFKLFVIGALYGELDDQYPRS